MRRHVGLRGTKQRGAQEGGMDSWPRHLTGKICLLGKVAADVVLGACTVNPSREYNSSQENDESAVLPCLSGPFPRSLDGCYQYMVNKPRCGRPWGHGAIFARGIVLCAKVQFWPSSGYYYWQRVHESTRVQILSSNLNGFPALIPCGLRRAHRMQQLFS